ncbi:MAG: hypothetical protein N2447_00260 [Thermoanaerobaculum sp.]|nr:hypothetical protein [Thermoanaerobaculum sp.]
MRLTWAGWLFLIFAWGAIGGLTGFCLWRVLVRTEKKQRRRDEEAVIITP